MQPVRRNTTTKKLVKEFKEFAFRGNVIDMAVGVMIGAAFGSIVTSLVNDVFMPLLSLLTGEMDATALSLTIGSGENAATLNYGSFISAVVDFLLIAVCIFAFVKLISSIRARMEPAEKPQPQRTCPYCFEPIHVQATRCPHCTAILHDSIQK